MPETIPELFDAAVAAVPGQGVARGRRRVVHLRRGARRGSAGRRRRSASLGHRSRRPGARHHAQHARTTCSPGSPSAYAGSILVTANPRSAEAEQAGLVGQVRPRLVVTDPGLDAVMAGGARLGRRRRRRRRAPVRGGDGRRRHRPGAARRRGRAHPDVGHDRPLEARHADAPRLRDGRRGVPVVDGARPGRPADDLAAAVPHQRARVLDARLGRRAGQPRAAAGLLGEHVPRLGPPPRRDRVQRDRGDARDPDAPAGAARRRRQPAAPVLHRPGAAERAPARDRGALRPRIVCGYAMSETPYGTIWPRGTRPYGTLGSIRQHPTLGVVNEGRVMRDGRPAAARRGRASSSCATPP